MPKGAAVKLLYHLKFLLGLGHMTKGLMAQSQVVVAEGVSWVGGGQGLELRQGGGIVFAVVIAFGFLIGIRCGLSRLGERGLNR